MNILLSIPAIAWLLISSIFFAAGEYLSKRWGMNPNLGNTLIVLLAYAMSSLMWLPSLLHKNQLALMGTIWLVLATVATITIGLLVFHEKLTTLQWVGIILAFIALLFLGSAGTEPQ